MTEKRFWYDFEDCTGAKIVDFKEDKEYSLETIGDFQTIEELLNMLHEENEQLKQQLNDCERKKQNIKDLLLNSEPIHEQKKIQKLIYKGIFDLIDEKIEEYCNIPSLCDGGVTALKELKNELVIND